ncbi:hypothetical protein KDK95_18100 [Actinospica sp. MGRD01-02]|uniref:Uncharacterized protein n=1 Tax=Actinospica acidithermotolerans TaxID=2828514 RepID=A0A941ED07_9ACTN|nr:hypothetical protein [Actinospica acidithermotolerans]MBR7828232.1 hypothetical protein [Actinospica acidithermotolerans]
MACWIDLATWEIDGWSMAEHHRAELVVDALKMALGHGPLEPGCIAPSDRGGGVHISRVQGRIEGVWAMAVDRQDRLLLR